MDAVAWEVHSVAFPAILSSHMNASRQSAVMSGHVLALICMHFCEP
jgi:hypothetical protein